MALNTNAIPYQLLMLITAGTLCIGVLGVPAQAQTFTVLHSLAAEASG